VIKWSLVGKLIRVNKVGCLRGASAPLFKTSPSPFKERGTQGVRSLYKLRRRDQGDRWLRTDLLNKYLCGNIQLGMNSSKKEIATTLSGRNIFACVSIYPSNVIILNYPTNNDSRLKRSAGSAYAL